MRVKRNKLYLCVIASFCAVNVFADQLTNESQIESAAAIKKEKRLEYNEAESNDFYIDQCPRDVNGVCDPSIYYDRYISVNNYIQDPYNHLITGGGRHKVTESDIANKNIVEQFLTNGTYDVQVGAGWALLNTWNNNYAYGGTLFAQSGHVKGFALGGAMQVANPFTAPGKQNLSGEIPYSLFPITRDITPSEAYIEYQLPDHVQVDAGWIFLQTPWMNSYDDAMLVTAPFQGVLANYQLSTNWRLTGIATNAYEEMGSTSFNQDSMYNSSYGNFVTRTPYGTQNIFSDNYTSPGSLALGSVYHPNEDYELNMWAYSFSGYANTIYADSNYDIHVNPFNKFNVGVQVGNQNTLGMQTTSPQQAGDGSVNSNLAGAKIGYSYDDWFDVEASYDTTFGPKSGFYGGDFISPYSFTIVNDPLYTSGLAAGLIEMGAGNSYRIGTIFRPIPGNSRSKIELAYEQFNTVSPAKEYDVDLKYVPETGPKGLILHLEGDYATAPTTDIVNGGNFLFIEGIVTYNY